MAGILAFLTAALAAVTAFLNAAWNVASRVPAIVYYVLAAFACGFVSGCHVRGWFALLAAAILGLNYVLAPWLSALIVGVVVIALGAGLALFGKSRLKADALVPHRTLNSLREDQAWIRDQVS